MSDDRISGPAYRFATDRIEGRCWRPDDAVEVRRALDANDRHLRPWIPFMRDEPRSLRQTMEWLRALRAEFDGDLAHRWGLFVEAVGRKELAGELCLFRRVGEGGREVGYWLHHDHVGRGLASHAAAVATRFAFELDGADRVEIHCDPRNAPSWKVAERLGFRHEATLARRGTDSEGEIVDLMVWTLFASDYPASPAAEVDVRAWDGLGDAIPLGEAPSTEPSQSADRRA